MDMYLGTCIDMGMVMGIGICTGIGMSHVYGHLHGDDPDCVNYARERSYDRMCIDMHIDMRIDVPLALRWACATQRREARAGAPVLTY